MRKLLPLLLASLCALNASARELSADQALQRAVATLSNAGGGTRGIGASNYTLAHTKKSVSNGATLYYVFSNRATGGFMIASADTRANAVLGETDNGSYEQALTVPGFRAWLSACQETLQQLSSTAEAQLASAMPAVDIPEQVITSADGTQRLTIAGQCNTPDPTLPATVEPLLGTIAWNQGTPFNNLCPKQINSTELCVTGCVATATAQVMKYYEWPKQGTGSYSYTPKGFGYELSADFSKSTYDWDNMLDNYQADYTAAQGNAVAQLMKDVGIGENMDYDIQSGTPHSYVLIALTSYFGYNKGMLMCNRYNYNYTEWNNLLKNELVAKRPLIYSGSNRYEATGHEFVIDGYNEVGNYHVNWGWGGSSNGYFDINVLYPKNQGLGGSNGGYASEQLTILNCFPDLDGTSTPQYQLAINNEIALKEGTLSYTVVNNGMAYYTGQLGFVVVDGDKIVNTYKGTDVVLESNLGLAYEMTVDATLDNLGITPETLANKTLRVYPYYSDTDGNKVPLCTAAFANYVTLSVDQEGNIVSEFDKTINANLSCERIEITRDYLGFNVKATAQISNSENCPTFDRPVFMYVYDENSDLLADGANFAFFEPGKTREMEFSCKLRENKTMVVGKTYHVSLCFYAQNNTNVIPGSYTTVTLKDPGAAPSLAYDNFAIDKTVIAPDEDITVSFDIINSGGFGAGDYYIHTFSTAGGTNISTETISDINVPAGKSTITKPCTVNQPEGSYFFMVYMLVDNDWQPISGKLFFDVENPDTAISSVNGDTVVSDQYYNLQGHRVSVPAQGLYIRNGKKFVKQ